MSDIHNDNARLNEMLKKIKFDKKKDHLYVLGDLFDRADYNPQPMGVYYTLSSLEEAYTILRGNHDEWLANYIFKYLDTPENKRNTLLPYNYNTFRLIKDRIPDVSLRIFAEWIKEKPLQIETIAEGEKYLFAHAQTSAPEDTQENMYYLMGRVDFQFLRNGIEGYTSVCGHTPTSNIRGWYGDEYRPKEQEIWVNPQKNVYMIDCGCGFARGRLGCMRLEDKKMFYV